MGGGVVHKKPIEGGLPKKGGFGQFAYLRGTLDKKEGGGVSEWGVDTQMHNISSRM